MKTLLMMLFFGLNGVAAPSEIQVPQSLMKKLKSFESSAGLYLEDLDRYLIASDDTTKKDDPWLFLMDRNGFVDEKPVVIHGLQKMTDIESISQDEHGILYILSSQSLNKSGKSKIERTLFVKAKRTGQNIQALDILELRPLLLGALKKSTLGKLPLDQMLDVESHFIKNGKLFLGLKEPQAQAGHGLIISLGSVEYLFRNKQIEYIQVVAELPFAAVSNNADLLSDIFPVEKALILTTTSENNKGRLWKLDLNSNQLQVLQEFEGVRPEGMAYNPKQDELIVLFDQGDDTSLFETLDFKQ